MVIKIRSVFLALFAILVFILVILCIDHLYTKNRIGPDVYFKNINLGGKSPQEVNETLDGLQFTFLGPEGEVLSVPLDKLGISLNTAQIFQTGYDSRPSRRLLGYHFLDGKEKFFISFEYHLDQALLSKSIDSIIEQLRQDPENAYIRVGKDNQAEIVPEKFGYQFNRDDIQRAVVANLDQSDNPLVINVPVAQQVPPPITASTLKAKGINSLMISFSTKFDPTVTSRVHNIKLGAATINNYLLAPGEVFSFNKVIGNPTAEKGYQAANVIIGGELVPGIGGGCCQISSTLYNAALLANLEIVERNNHQLTVPYIDPGRDATVSYPYKNLSFRNNKNHYVLITAGVQNDELTINFFGQPLSERVEITTKILATYPPPPTSAPKDKVEGYPGYLLEVWKTVYHGENVVEEKKISVDEYMPFLYKLDH